MIVNLPKIDKSIELLEQKNAKEKLERVVDMAKHTAEDLVEFKVNALENHKQNLKNILDVANSILRYYHNLSTLGELDEVEAKKKAYEEIAKLKYGKNGYFFIINDSYFVISHYNKRLIGKDFSQVKDIKGKYFIVEMIEKTRRYGDSFTNYWWTREIGGDAFEKLSYAKLFKPWRIYLGTGVYIDDVQKEIDKKQIKLKMHLDSLVTKHKVGKNGYIYIFNKDGDIIVHPKKELISNRFKAIINPSTSNLLYRDLISVHKTTKTLRYKNDKAGDRGNFIYEKILWIEHIPSLDWYIASSIYIDEFKETSAELKKNILQFGIFALIMSMILTIFLFRRLLLPLQKLSQTAKHIANGNYKARVEVTSEDEIGELGRNFNIMVDTVEYNINNLDMNVREKTGQLKEQKDSFENLFQKSSDGLLIIENGKFIEANEAIVRMLKYQNKEELLNQHPSNLSPEYQPDGRKSYEKANEMIQIALDRGKHFFEWMHKKSDGENFWAEIVLTKITQNKKDIIHVVWRDIDKRKETESKLAQLSKNLEQRVVCEVEKNRKKDQQIIHQSRLAQMGEMISMIAHQWRQPLTAINATSIALNISARLDEITSQKVIEKTDKISEYSQHLSTTINDFRNFFKSNKEKKEISYEELIDSVLGIVAIAIKNKNIQLIQNIDCREKFKTYPNEIKQVILNLLKNAEDILLEKKITNPIIQIKTYKKSDKHILEILDNGGGIPIEIIDNIFEPYFTTKNKKDGTGLGLYMSKTIIEEHCGGELSVSNNQNGAVFKISL